MGCGVYLRPPPKPTVSRFLVVCKVHVVGPCGVQGEDPILGYVVIVAIPLQTPEAPDAARGSHRSISSRHLCGNGTTPKISGRSA